MYGKRKCSALRGMMRRAAILPVIAFAGSFLAVPAVSANEIENEKKLERLEAKFDDIDRKVDTINEKVDGFGFRFSQQSRQLTDLQETLLQILKDFEDLRKTLPVSEDEAQTE